MTDNDECDAAVKDVFHSSCEREKKKASKKVDVIGTEGKKTAATSNRESLSPLTSGVKALHFQ